MSLFFGRRLDLIDNVIDYSRTAPGMTLDWSNVFFFDDLADECEINLFDIIVLAMTILAWSI